MKKYKRDIYKAIGILVPLLLAGILGRFNDAYFAYLCFAVYFLASSYSLYTKINYRYAGGDHVVFPTVNDSYTKITTLVFGILTMVAAMGYGFYTDHYGLHVAGLCLLGAIIFVNGLYDLPNGELEIKNGFFSFYGLDNKIALKDVATVEIYSGKIVVLTHGQEKLMANNFAIDEKHAALLKAYIVDQTNGQTTVSDHLSNIPYLNMQN